MNVQSLFEQLLKSGMGAAGQMGSQGRSSGLGKVAMGGVLGMLLGNRRGGGLGSSALKLGSVAAIGAMAYKAYQEYQSRQQAQSPAAAAGAPLGRPGAFDAGNGFAALPASQQEVHSRAMLKALIAAAKSDGHLDARERGLVQDELHRMQADAQTRAWVQAELERPVEPEEVAAAAEGPEMAAEMYLASLLVVDQTSTMERAYLDALARSLKLAPELKADLEARAAAAAAAA
ncbi:MAG: tellurite resistance TerB family protein [Rubrivivax sp.]|nr:tellurite resistance TerB family protein [Rubrivivax sp.]